MRTWADLVKSQHCLFEDLLLRNLFTLAIPSCQESIFIAKSCFDCMKAPALFGTQCY
jgi:hypothetical protein